MSIVLLLLIVNSLLIFAALFIAIINNFRSHIALIYMIFIQIFYLMFTPWYNYLDKDYMAFNTRLSEFDYSFGLFVLLIHLIFFYLGYSLKQFLVRKKVSLLNNVDWKHTGAKVNKLYFFFLCLLTVNAISGEISLYDILVGKEESETLGFKGASYYISSLADSLIILFLMSVYFRSNKYLSIPFMLLTIILFLILGFRYRLLLLGIGMLLIFIKNNLKSRRQILKIPLIGFAFFLVFMFFSENRINFYSQSYDKIIINPFEYNYSSIRDNTQGSIVDFAMYKILREGNAEYDFGISMFIYPLIMVTPSIFFENSEKPYPAPQIKTLDKALDVPRSYGQACTFLGMSFFSFSYVGIILFSFLFGLCVSLWEINRVNGVDFFLNASFLLASFQLYTRGYLGLFLLPLAYMLLAVYLVKFKIIFSRVKQ